MFLTLSSGAELIIKKGSEKTGKYDLRESWKKVDFPFAQNQTYASTPLIILPSSVGPMRRWFKP